MRDFKATYRDRQRNQRKSKRWYLEFRDQRQTIRRLAGFTDRSATQELGRKISLLLDYRAAGQPLSRDLTRWIEELPLRLRDRLGSIGLLDTVRVAALQPLTEHLDAFEAALANRGITTKHVALVTGRARRLVEGSGINYWSDLGGEVVERFLAQERESGRINVQTSNFYLQAIKQFAKWMVEEGHADSSPVSHLRARNPRRDRRHLRRALLVEEIRSLLSRTQDEPPRFGMTGPERALVYLLAVESGLRASELASLRCADFDFTGTPPTVTIRAAAAKSGRDKIIPLRAGTAAQVKEISREKLPTANVFSMPPSHATARMVRRDLEAAGIPYEDESGRKADFHALRHTFITFLKQGRVHSKTMQTLARHSTAALTLDCYTHSYQADEVAAIENLPELSPEPPQASSSRATGTDGADAPPGVLAVCLASKHGREETPVDAHASSRHPDGPQPDGGVAERPNAAVLKTAVGQPQVTEEQVVTPPSDSVLASCLASHPELGELIAAWADLPHSVRAGILAMVRTTSEDQR